MCPLSKSTIRTSYAKPIVVLAVGHLGCYHLLATVNNGEMNMGVQICLRDPIFNFFAYIPRNGTVDHVIVQFLSF